MFPFFFFFSPSALTNRLGGIIIGAVSTAEEIRTAIPKLSRTEIEAIREWIDDYLEDQLELTDEIKEKLDRSRREIAAGQYTTRRAK